MFARLYVILKRMNAPTCTVSTTLKSPYPTFPYQAIKDAIVGKKYEVSLTFVGSTRARALNEAYRQKTYVPNVLSFPLDETHGDIFICPEVARKEAAKFDLSVDGYIAYLFIHGLLHLKGHDHSDTMDALEQRYLKKFSIA